MGKREVWIILVIIALAVVQLIVFGLALMGLRSSKPAFALDDELSRQTLKGIQGVHVVIESLTPEIGGEELDKEGLRKGTVQKLEGGGITVLSEPEIQMTPGRPHIYVHTSILKYNYVPVYIYRNRVEFAQDVYLVRDYEVKTGAVTWSVSAIGLASKLEDIGASMEKLVDYFVEAYVSVNPKTG